MPPRRSHTKSRNGCDQCKKRRVKCDEQGPPCSNCTSRELECFYSKAPVARSLQSTSASPNSGCGHHTTPSLIEPYQQAPFSNLSTDSELRRLELMHKFSTETYRSLCNSPADFDIWQMIIPRLALSHDFLMKGILAIASLHIASSMDPLEGSPYINTALEYHNQTLTPFRHAIDAINHGNCDAVFAHSVVTTIISIALPQLTTERGEISMIEKIIVAAELLQGVGSIRRLCRPWMKFKLFTSRGDFWEESKVPLDRETEAALNNLSTLTDEVADVDQRRVLSDTLQTLRRCFTRYSGMRDVASSFAWLTVADKEFSHALRSRQPMALLILLYWGVLLHDLDGKMWWAKNSGSALILELLAELQPYQSRWESILLWPRQKMGPQGHLVLPNGTDIRPSH
ncbi:hypothetical protein BDV12DRAFT_174662 [Aspergillus spectabilis]